MATYYPKHKNTPTHQEGPLWERCLQREVGRQNGTNSPKIHANYCEERIGIRMENIDPKWLCRQREHARLFVLCIGCAETRGSLQTLDEGTGETDFAPALSVGDTWLLTSLWKELGLDDVFRRVLRTK